MKLRTERERRSLSLPSSSVVILAIYCKFFFLISLTPLTNLNLNFA